MNLYTVTETDLFGLTDTTGHNANISGSFGSSLLAAGANYAFRGNNFAPHPRANNMGTVGRQLDGVGGIPSLLSDGLIRWLFTFYDGRRGISAPPVLFVRHLEAVVKGAGR
ncbi:MAG: hypothetical protein Fur0032_24090 [Terrimicrobiaceae bacterium]